MGSHFATRRVEFDAAHRVPDHASKCRHIHGHRYALEVTCEGGLALDGEERGMVIDFGFLKEEIDWQITEPLDHHLVLSVHDELVRHLARKEDLQMLGALAMMPGVMIRGDFGAILVLPDVPTAENIARYCFRKLAGRILARSQGRARLHHVRLYETPNCWADFHGAEDLSTKGDPLEWTRRTSPQMSSIDPPPEPPSALP